MDINFNIYKDELKDLYSFTKYAVGEIYFKPDVFSFNVCFSGVSRAIYDNIGNKLDIVSVSEVESVDKEIMEIVFDIFSTDGVNFKVSLVYEGMEDLKQHKLSQDTTTLKKAVESIDQMSRLYAKYHYGDPTKENIAKFKEEMSFFKAGMAYVYKKKFNIDLGRVL